jgi:hypothetical protein
MLTLSPSEPVPPYLELKLVRKFFEDGKTAIVEDVVPRKLSTAERFLYEHRQRVEGPVYYPTNTHGEFLISRKKTLFLCEVPPTDYDFVIEFLITADLAVMDADSFKVLRCLLNVSSAQEAFDRLEEFPGYKGVYYKARSGKTLVALSPKVDLDFTPSYREYLNGSAQFLPETAFANYH